MIKLVIFDMDGVIFEGKNFWLDLHRALGTEDEARRLWNTYGATDYTRLAVTTVKELWRGRDAGPFLRFVESRPYVNGVQAVFTSLKERGIKIAIVSTGPSQLAERVRSELGVHCALANWVEIADGHFTGELKILVDNNRKDKVAAHIMSTLGASPRETVVVGDTSSDARMAAVAGLFVAYDPEENLRAAAILSRGHLSKLIDVLNPYLSGAAPCTSSPAKQLG